MEKLDSALVESNYAKDSEYEIWCVNNGRQPFTGNADHEDNLDGFLMQKSVDISPIDDVDYPGLNHAAAITLDIGHRYLRHAALSSNLYSYSYGADGYGDLTRHRCRNLLDTMNQKLAMACMANEFEIGKTVGRRWVITSVLVGAEGCFNRGTSLV
jgi:hypothetical protein